MANKTGSDASAPTLDELRSQHEEAGRRLAEAEAVHAARPPLTAEEVEAIYRTGLQAYDDAKSDQDKHDAANAALRKLEERGHKSRAVDHLAQLVIDARGDGEEA